MTSSGSHHENQAKEAVHAIVTSLSYKLLSVCLLHADEADGTMSKSYTEKPSSDHAIPEEALSISWWLVSDSEAMYRITLGRMRFTLEISLATLEHFKAKLLATSNEANCIILVTSKVGDLYSDINSTVLFPESYFDGDGLDARAGACHGPSNEEEKTSPVLFVGGCHVVYKPHGTPFKTNLGKFLWAINVGKDFLSVDHFVQQRLYIIG